MNIPSCVQARRCLDPGEIEEVRALQMECPEGDRLQLNYPFMSRPENGDDHFLWREDGELVAYTGTMHYCPEEVEIVGMVHPSHRRKGISTALLERAVASSRERGFSRMLLVTESGSEGGMAFAQKHGRRRFTEHLLTMEASSFRPARTTIEMVELPSGDTAEIEEIMLESFGEVIEKPWARRFVGRLDGRAVGMIDVDLEGREAILSGFAVLPGERGKGYGRQILSAVVSLLLKDADSISIEVETTNQRALDLYLSNGFQRVASYDYFEIAL
jgi:ribosomal protein S18 acetylase RimI-like enzyme